MVEFPSNKIIADAVIRSLKATRSKFNEEGVRRTLLLPAKITEFPSDERTRQLLGSINQAFSGRTAFKAGPLGITQGQFEFLTSVNIQGKVLQIQQEQQQKAQQLAQQKAESDFLSKIQVAINKQLESFTPPQITTPPIIQTPVIQTPMIESESQVKQVEQSPISLIPLAIIGAVLLG